MPRPARPVLSGVWPDVALPVLPVGPDGPELATGEAVAFDVASPVSPVLVELDRASTSPEAPLVAVGVTLALAAPPAPPLALGGGHRARRRWRTDGAGDGGHER